MELMFAIFAYRSIDEARNELDSHPVPSLLPRQALILLRHYLSLLNQVTSHELYTGASDSPFDSRGQWLVVDGGKEFGGLGKAEKRRGA